MSGFTGYHPIQATANITQFEEAGMAAYNKLCESNKLFIDSLAAVWWSPNAVDFGTKFTPELYNEQGETLELINNTIVDCVSAYNSNAEGNGADAIPDNHQVFDAVNYAPQGTNMGYSDMQDISDLGVGMDKDKVREYLQEYKNNLNAIETDLSNIPFTIAFYDPAGEQQSNFKTRVTKIIETLEAKYTEMETKISTHLIDEENKVVEGARQAAQTLSN